MTRESSPRRRVRKTLLVLLWAWAACIALVVDLFWNVEEFDRVRPRAGFYRDMRFAAHRMVGERYRENDELGRSGRVATHQPPTAAPGWRGRLEDSLRAGRVEESQRLLREAEEHPTRVAPDALLGIRHLAGTKKLLGAYARAAAAVAAATTGDAGSDKQEALARSALEAEALKLGGGEGLSAEDWRTTVVVLERLDWVSPEAAWNRDSSELHAMRRAVGRFLEGQERGAPTERLVEVLRVARHVGDGNTARLCVECIAGLGDAPWGREALLAMDHAAEAVMAAGSPAQRDAARTAIDRAAQRSVDSRVRGRLVRLHQRLAMRR